MRLCLVEDDAVVNLEPLVLTRAAFDLRCGALTLMERQMRYFAPSECGAWIRADLRALCEISHPGLSLNEPSYTVDQPVILTNARWLAPLPTRGLLGAPCLNGTGSQSRSSPSTIAEHGLVGMAGDAVAFVVLPHGTPEEWSHWPVKSLDGWRTALPQRNVGGCLINAPWDLITNNAAALSEDFESWHAHPENGWVEGGATATAAGDRRVQIADERFLGPRDQCMIARTAEVEPGVIVDTRTGPVIIDSDTVIEAFSRLQGPCYIGRGSRIFGGRITASTIGPQCRLGGEVQNSLVHGYTNKCHDGFLGHSYLGEWVNFGAGTQTSDLRNDYEAIRMCVHGESTNTGCLKLGSLVGDFTRTAIGTLLNVGTSVGPFCELLPYGSLLPRRIPAFTQYGHGELRARIDLRRIISAAERVMKRRDRIWTDAHTDSLFSLYEHTENERRELVVETEQPRMYTATCYR